MPDDTNTTPHDEETEPAAGEIIRPARFGIGARATILMGLTVGAVAVAAVISAAPSPVTSKV